MPIQPAPGPVPPVPWWPALATVVLSLAFLVGAAAPAGADHAQSSSGKVVVFDHRVGNEWWVEVFLGGQDGGQAATVQATDDDVTWVTLTKRSWGNWAASFHIEPGHNVRFRATWSGGAQVESCWFTHPQGVEMCPDPSPPQPMWQARHMGNAGIASGSGDMAVGDADRDGRRDVVTATRNGVHHFEWTGTAWAVQRLPGSGGANAVAVGDGNGDGISEVYVMENNLLVRYAFADGAWVRAPLWTFAEPFASDMTLGDIDGIAGPELYVGLADGTSAVVYKVRLGDRDDVLERSRIAMMAGHLESLWIGDGDRDGAFELYLGHGTSHAAKTSRLRHTATGWELTQIDGTGSEFGEQYVVAGDGDRDGRPEIYSISDDGEFRRVSFDPSTGWNVQTPLTLDVPVSGLFLGDGDLEPGAELYVPSHDGRLHQIRWDGVRWVATLVARPLDVNLDNGDAALVVVGDGDGDGRREVYLSVSYSTGVPPDEGHTEVYQLAQHDGPAGFAATFSNVKGNEWWIETTVQANQPLQRVDVILNGGAARPLDRTSWGTWAKSYHAPTGTVVRFLATATSGEAVLSGCYRWPTATPVSCADAAPGFDHTGGNEWWVQVKVTGMQPTRVLARDDGGAWTELQLRSWGDWAASFHIEPGHDVTFRTLVNGQWYESCAFSHPGGAARTGGTACVGTRVA